jgi:hypothetical protein
MIKIGFNMVVPKNFQSLCEFHIIIASFNDFFFLIISRFSLVLCVWELSCLVPFARSFFIRVVFLFLSGSFVGRRAFFIFC